MPYKKPKTEKQAWSMVFTGWSFLLMNKIETITDIMKKGTYWVLTFYMLLGGSIFMYKYFMADKFEIEKASPIGQVQQNSFSMIPQANAQDKIEGPPIRWDGKLYGFEDVRYEARVSKTEPIILVYDKNTKEVYRIRFNGPEDYKQQFMK